VFTTLVLICSLAVTPDLRQCNRDNAVHVLQVPGQIESAGRCGFQGQAYIAGTAVGQNLAEDETIKVLCITSSNRPAT
jgi:hypothetical protein